MMLQRNALAAWHETIRQPCADDTDVMRYRELGNMSIPGGTQSGAGSAEEDRQSDTHLALRRALTVRTPLSFGPS